MQAYFDAHTHIHFPAYDADREQVFTRTKDAGVKMVTVGTQWSNSLAAVEFAKSHKGDVWAAVGFHPAHFSVNWYHDKNEQNHSEREKFDIEKLKKLSLEPEVVAIGECGLDYFHPVQSPNREAEIKNQKEGFFAQIELAAKVKKPLMVHCRSAFPDLIEILKARSSKLKAGAPGVIHFFSGSREDAKNLLDLGFYFTFGGVVTFSRDYDEVIKLIPLERILSETDAPCVAPVPYRGKRNEPAYVVEVVKKISELRNVSLPEMREKIYENADRIFRLGI